MEQLISRTITLDPVQVLELVRKSESALFCIHGNALRMKTHDLCQVPSQIRGASYHRCAAVILSCQSSLKAFEKSSSAHIEGVHHLIFDEVLGTHPHLTWLRLPSREGS